MGRGLLLLVIAIGFVSSLVGGVMRRAPATRADTQAHMVGPGEPAASTLPPIYDATEGTVELRRDGNGHFYAEVQINGAPIHMLVDTGATGIALSRDDARAAGVATSIGMPDVVGEGADGEVHGEFVTLDSVSLGGTTAEHMPAMVLNSGDQSLLGQEFLARFKAVEIHGDTMVLR
jgi:aspartyl protease family protein